ncbi:MAG: T9SS type A sorting domain-containing protein [Bacteroidota bacterium]
MRPGDANNSGHVSIVDVLYHGLSYGAVGSSRPNPSFNFFDVQLYQPWQQTFPTGENYAHADGSGDGIVNDVDLFVITTNFGAEAPGFVEDSFEVGTINESLPIGFDLQNTGVPEDSLELNFPIFLGDQNNPVENFHGIVFSILFDETHIDPSSLSIDIEDGWVNNNGQDDVLAFFAADPGQAGKFDVAITRKDLGAISGFGAMASFSIILEENVWDLTVSTDLQISNVKIITPELQQIAAFAYPLTLDLLTSTTNSLSDESVQIYPNPFSEQFLIYVEKPIQNIQVFDQQGRLHWSRDQLSTGNHEIQLNGRQSGLFILQYERDGQVYYQKMIRNP